MGTQPDGYRLSTYLHKERDSRGGKLAMGPLWDFDQGFLNYRWYTYSWRNWEYDNAWWLHPDRIPFWWTKMMSEPVFRQAVRDRWAQWRAGS